MMRVRHVGSQITFHMSAPDQWSGGRVSRLAAAQRGAEAPSGFPASFRYRSLRARIVL